MQGTGGRGAAARVDASPTHGCQGREGAVPTGNQLHRLRGHSSVGALCTLLPGSAALYGARESQQGGVCCPCTVQCTGGCAGSAHIMLVCAYTTACVARSVLIPLHTWRCLCLHHCVLSMHGTVSALNCTAGLMAGPHLVHFLASAA